MNRFLKVTLFRLLGLVGIIYMNSCLEPADLMTESAKTGGLIDVTPTLQYKPATTQSVDLEILIYNGPVVQSINVYKKFTHFINDAGSVSVSESEEVLLGTISVAESNLKDTLLVINTYTWDDLSQGIPQLPGGYDVPTDPVNAQVGDYFTLKYVSVLADGREVAINPKTYIVVANFFAGYYVSYYKYFHPTLEGVYPTDPYRQGSLMKELFTISNSDCSTFFALWTDATMEIYLNPDNSVEFTVSNFNYIVNEGDPYDLTNHSHYDPITKVIYLYYYYEASGGYRVFWEVLTPTSN